MYTWPIDICKGFAASRFVLRVRFRVRALVTACSLSLVRNMHVSICLRYHRRRYIKLCLLFICSCSNSLLLMARLSYVFVFMFVFVLLVVRFPLYKRKEIPCSDP